jgi:rhodanese-related sulfurtransferase
MGKQTCFERLVAEAKKNITEILPNEVASKVKSGQGVIIDVREKDEWDEGHIPGAIHLSRGTIELEIEEKVPDMNATTFAIAVVEADPLSWPRACRKLATRMSAR